MVGTKADLPFLFGKLMTWGPSKRPLLAGNGPGR